MVKLPKSFYTRTDVVQIARDLLGKYLMTNIDGKITGGMIVETEAYRGADDKACHAYPNKKTKRTEIFFNEGGLAYVYLCYGIHHLFNITTGPANQADAVLIRALQPEKGIETMLKRRKMSRLKTNICAGPGCLTQALGIKTSSHYGKDLTKNIIWLEDWRYIPKEDEIITGPRIGIAYAEEAIYFLWRFRIKDNKWVSKAK